MKKVQFTASVFGCFIALTCQAPLAQTAANPATQAVVATVPANTQGQWKTPLQVQRRLEIGQATERLFGMQHNPVNPRPRPIYGDQAARSYERYLKSFDYPIPELFEVGMDTKK